MSGTLDYLDPEGNVNFLLVDWVTLNQWLSVLNGNDKISIKIPEGLNRESIIEELEDRRMNKSNSLRAAGMRVFGKDLGKGKDWREYENEEGYSHLEELLIFQPTDWRKQAREYFFRLKFNILRESNSQSLRTCDIKLTTQDGVSDFHSVFMRTPLLAVLFHPSMRRVARYEPLNFLLSYGASDPRPTLLKELELSEDEKEALFLELSPLDYFFEFQKRVNAYDIELLTKIGQLAHVPRLQLMNELDFSRQLLDSASPRA